VPLPAGTALGPYEILAPLGAGGMGEVYRAKDTRLDRIVAVKVLPSELSANPALRERLEREAKAISSLTHPHICTLHDVGREAGIDYLVMEHLEGESLADRLRKGALPLEQVPPLSRPTASGWRSSPARKTACAGSSCALSKAARRDRCPEPWTRSIRSGRPTAASSGSSPRRSCAGSMPRGGPRRPSAIRSRAGEAPGAPTAPSCSPPDPAG
jgi:hypothetical protein